MGGRPRPIPRDEALRTAADRQNRAYLADPDEYLRRLGAGLDPAPPQPPRGSAGLHRKANQ